MRFRSSRPQKASASTTHHRKVAGITPTLPAVSDANVWSGKKVWEDAPCTKNVAANQKKDVPSVVLKAGILSRSVISPLSKPIPVPISSPISAASQTLFQFVL